MRRFQVTPLNPKRRLFVISEQRLKARIHWHLPCGGEMWDLWRDRELSIFIATKTRYFIGNNCFKFLYRLWNQQKLDAFDHHEMPKFCKKGVLKVRFPIENEGQPICHTPLPIGNSSWSGGPGWVLSCKINK